VLKINIKQGQLGMPTNK